MALEPGSNYGDDLSHLQEVAPQSLPLRPPQGVLEARRPGSGNRGRRPEARVALDGTRWCVTCNTILASSKASYCNACDRRWPAQRASHARRRAADGAPVRLGREEAMALHQAKDILGDLAWKYRAALTHRPRASIELGEDLLVAVKDITYLLDTIVPDVRPPADRDTSWRLLLPRPEPEAEHAN